MATEVKKRPAALPAVRLNGTGYYVDLEHRLFRDMFNPVRHIDFDSSAGKQLCQQAGVVTCLACGASVIISTERKVYELRCVRCGVRLQG